MRAREIVLCTLWFVNDRSRKTDGHFEMCVTWKKSNSAQDLKWSVLILAERNSSYLQKYILSSPFIMRLPTHFVNVANRYRVNWKIWYFIWCRYMSSTEYEFWKTQWKWKELNIYFITFDLHIMKSFLQKAYIFFFRVVCSM